MGRQIKNSVHLEESVPYALLVFLAVHKAVITGAAAIDGVGGVIWLTIANAQQSPGMRT